MKLLFPTLFSPNDDDVIVSCDIKVLKIGEIDDSNA